jgi:hypothetical protein
MVDSPPDAIEVWIFGIQVLISYNCRSRGNYISQLLSLLLASLTRIHVNQFQVVYRACSLLRLQSIVSFR